jgi:pimeloyl-ACP methyl ester carboxylesterase
MAFRKDYVEVGENRVWFLQAGDGSPLIYLHDTEELTPRPAYDLLSGKFRVIALTAPSPIASSEKQRDATKLSLARTAKALGLTQFDLVASGSAGLVALRLTLDHPELVRSLVLESPPALSGALSARSQDADHAARLEAQLHDIATPTLLIFGTRDDVTPPTTGRSYKELIPNAHLVFVYDAGHAVAADRPEAFADVVADFLERGDAFLIRRTPSVLFP